MENFKTDSAAAFVGAHGVLNNVIHKICHDQWEKEVVAKKSKPHSIRHV